MDYFEDPDKQEGVQGLLIWWNPWEIILYDGTASDDLRNEMPEIIKAREMAKSKLAADWSTKTEAALKGNESLKL